MNTNTPTVTFGEDISIELTVKYSLPYTNSTHWEQTPEYIPLVIHDVKDQEQNDLTETITAMFSDEDLAYKTSLEVLSKKEIEELTDL